jgi:hypothetical protein
VLFSSPRGLPVRSLASGLIEDIGIVPRQIQSFISTYAYEQGRSQMLSYRRDDAEAEKEAEFQEVR